MAQLGHFEHRVPDTSGNAISGASVTIYREGATVNGDQSGTSPLTVTVRHKGEMAAADTAFINTTTGTTYTVDSVTATTVVLSGFVGTLALTGGDRIIASNSKPTLYGDDQGGATTSNPLTTSATGIAQCWIGTPTVDVIVSGGGATTTLFASQSVSFERSSVTTNSPAIWVDDSGNQVVSINTVASDVFMRIGVRGQTAGISGEQYGLLSSHSYTADQGAADETVAVYGINTLSGATNASATAVGVSGEVQYIPSAANTGSAPVIGVQGVGRYWGTHASAVLTNAYGGSFLAKTTSGDVGTCTNLRSLNVSAPAKDGGASVSNAVALFVSGPAAGTGSTQNLAMVISGGTDEASDVLINSTPVRIDDDDNAGNSASAGRWVDIYRDWDGADTGPLYVGVHLTMNAEGSFDAGDDAMGFRAVVRTGTVAGDGTNLDVLAGYQSIVNHRSDQTLDELYGYKTELDNTGASGTVTTMAGIDVTLAATAGTITNVYSAIFRSLTPSASFASAGHLRCVPVSLATPATTLAALTAEQEGTLIFVTDSNNADNSGWYTFMNGAWYSWTPGGVAAASDT